MSDTLRNVRLIVISVLLVILPVHSVFADVVTEWNEKANVVVAAAKVTTPPGNRLLALVQTSVYEAVNAITKRYPSGRVKIEAPKDASIEAAVAAANRSILLKLLPSQQEMIETEYRQAIAAIPDGNAKTAGISVGEQAAAAVLASRSDENLIPESYRPVTAPGVYVPTVIPALSFWPMRKPWNMTKADQFRPGPPPSLKSELWARDYNESKSMGASNGSKRSAEQTAIARFWEATGPGIYYPLLRSVASTSGRDVTQNARFLAMAGQAMDDAMIAVFDAKYFYNFWRPITAIRNGDIDGNDATERDPSWTPFIETPMHPEYPCAHCIVASTVGTVIRVEVGNGRLPELSTTSPTAPGVTRRWATIDEFVREVSEARIYDGVHYRNSTEVGNAMGKKIGELTAAKF